MCPGRTALADAHLIATTLPGPGQRYKFYMCFCDIHAQAWESNKPQCIFCNVMQPPSQGNDANKTLVSVTFSCRYNC